MASIATKPIGLPRGLSQHLAALDVRLRSRDVLLGLGKVLLAANLVFLIATVVDFFRPLSGPVRFLNWLVWLAVMAWFGFRGIARPLARRRQWGLLAALADHSHPDLQERTTSAVDFLRESPHGHGSAELVEALVAQAEQGASQHRSAAPVSWRRAVAWLFAGGVALAVAVLPVAFQPDPCARLAKRFLAPWTATAPVSRYLVSVAPGHTVRLLGDDLAVSADVRPRFWFGAGAPATAQIEWTDAAGATRRSPLLADADAEGGGAARRFVGTLRGLTSSLRYRVVSADAVSPIYEATALEPPGASDLNILIQAPDYTKFAPREVQERLNLQVFEGSTLTFRVAPNRDMKRIVLVWPEATKGEGDEKRPGRGERALRSDGKAWTVQVTGEVSGSYTLIFEDEHGLAAGADDGRRLEVRADQPPQLALDGTGETQDARRDDRLAVKLAARDDVAVARAELSYEIERGGAIREGKNQLETGTIPVRLEGAGTRVAAGGALLGLEPLRLRPGDLVHYEVAVYDNRPDPPGPNVTRSESRALRIAEQAEPLANRSSHGDRERLRAELERLRKSAAENQQLTQALRYAADAALRGNGAWGPEQRDRLEAQVQGATGMTESLEKLARDFEESDAFAALAPPTEAVAEMEAAGAQEILERAKDAAESRQRLADLRLADSRLGSMRERLDELQKRFDELSQRADEREQLQSLAEREEELARRVAEAAEAGDRGRLEALRQEQEELRRQVDDLVRRSPELRAELMKQQAAAAENLSQEARELAQRQRREEQLNGDAAANRDRWQALAAAQRQLADDARRLALEVDTPLQENGRGRLNSEAIRRPVATLQRADSEPALQQVEESANELRRLARELGEVRDDPKVVARRLARRQEELAQETSAIVQQADTDAERAQLAERLKPLAEQQVRLRDRAVKVAESLADAGARSGLENAMKQAIEAFQTNPKDTLAPRQAEARDTLNRLADALPEAWQLRQQAQQKLQEARGQMEAIARELEQAMNETNAQAAQTKDVVSAARALAQRIEPLAARQRDAAKLLESVQPAGESGPQKERALRHAGRLAEEIERLRATAPPESDARAQAAPLSNWHVVGPFALDARPPFEVNAAVDLGRGLQDAQGRAAVWKLAQPADAGVVDLHGLLGSGPDTSNASAFAVLEYAAQRAGPAKLAIGSDDTITVWLNGRQVFDYQGRRSFAPAQDQADVTLIEGVNRFVVRCGNGDSDWKFGVGITPPPSTDATRRLARFESRKRQLSSRIADARGGLDRWNQGLEGREPDDARARRFARQLEATTRAEQQERAAPADSLARVLAGVRALEAPDTALYREAAMKALSGALGGENAATQDRAKAAVERLADRLEGRLTDAASARSLADAVRQGAPSNEAPPPRGHGDRLADELARLPDSELKDDAEARLGALHRLDRELSARTDDDSLQRAAAQMRQEAAKSLEKLADSLDSDEAAAPQTADNAPAARQPTDDDGLKPAHQDEARALTMRQQDVAEELRSLLAERVEPQQELQAEARELGESFAALRDEVRDLSQSGRAQSSAQAASDSLQQQAAPAMERGAQELGRGRMQPARDAQRQAADAAEQAARHAADLTAALRADAPGDGQNEGDQGEQGRGAGQESKSRQGLKSARAAQGQASQALAEAAQGGMNAREGAQAASTSMQDAAKGLRAAASRRSSKGRGLAQNPGGEGAPDPNNPDPSGAPGRAVDPFLGELDPATLEGSKRLWGQLSGQMRNELQQLRQGRYRSDYERLIQLYYRELAGENAPAPSGPR